MRSRSFSSISEAFVVGEPQPLEAQLLDLEEADESMMHWMRNFEANHEGWSHDSIMSYLESEKKSVGVVRDKMNSSIDEAETFLGN